MKRTLLLLFLAFVFVGEMFASTKPSTQGSEFYFSLMLARSSQQKQIELIISAPSAGVAKLTSSTGVTSSVTLTAGINKIILAQMTKKFDDASTVSSSSATGVSGSYPDCYTTIANSVQNEGYMVQTFDSTGTNELKVSVYAGLSGSSTSDCANIYPIEALGNEYYVIDRSANTVGWRFITTSSPGFNNGDYPAEALIVGAEDSTQIDIYPSCLIYGQSQSDTILSKIHITLNKGQTYLIKALSSDSTQKGQDNLVGTKIIATNDGNLSGNKCKKFAVFAGSVHGSGVNSPFNNGDLEYDQMFPVHLWGTDYIAGSTTKGQTDSIESNGTKYSQRAGRDEIVVVASQPCTQVYINGVYKTTLNQGDYYNYRDTTDEGTYVHATKAVEVGLFTTGENLLLSDASAGADGGPALIVLAPMQQYLRSMTFSIYDAEYSSGESNVSEHSLMITSLTSIRDSTYLNGVQLKNGASVPSSITGTTQTVKWSTITSNPKYSQLTIANILKSNAYTLKNTAPEDTLGGFNAFVYGSKGKNTGYGYSIGASAVSDSATFYLNGNTSLSSSSSTKKCVDKAVTFTPEIPSGTTVSYVEWDLDGDGTIDTVTTSTNDFTASEVYTAEGTYTITMIVHKSQTTCFASSTIDTATTQITIRKYVNLSVVNDTICKTSSYYAPLATALDTIARSKLGFRWMTTSSSGSDSTLVNQTVADTLTLSMNYGETRKFWRRTWSTDDNCTQYVDTFNITIKPITETTYTLDSVCYGTTISSKHLSGGDFVGTPTFTWYNSAGTVIGTTSSITLNSSVGVTYGTSTKFWVESSSGCMYVDTFVVNVLKKITNTLTASANKVCGDGKTLVTITATESGPVNSDYWKVSENGSSFTSMTPSVSSLVHAYYPTEAEEFEFISEGTCEKDTSTVTVSVNTPFTAQLDATSNDFVTAYTLPISGGNVTFNVTESTSGSYTYKWYPSDVSSTTNQYVSNVTSNGTYYVIVSDQDNLCKDTTNTITIALRKIELHTIIIPTSTNVLNNTFAEYDDSNEPLTNTFTYGYTTTIFNRYGQKIYEKKNGGWDGSNKGKVADAGVYFYVLEYYNSNNQTKMLKGTIEVVKP